jgi:hypothetical protein
MKERASGAVSPWHYNNNNNIIRKNFPAVHSMLPSRQTVEIKICKQMDFTVDTYYGGATSQLNKNNLDPFARLNRPHKSMLYNLKEHSLHTSLSYLLGITVDSEKCFKFIIKKQIIGHFVVYFFFVLIVTNYNTKTPQ